MTSNTPSGPPVDGRGSGDVSSSRWTRQRPAMITMFALVIFVATIAWYDRPRVDRDALARNTDAAAPRGMEGMDMNSDGAAVFTAAQLRQFGVLFGTVDQRVMTNDVRTVGTVMPDESRLSSVAPKFTGVVERLVVNTTGQRVRIGQPMAAIYSPDLLAAQQELLIARDLDRSVSGTSVPGVPGSSDGLLAAARQRLRLWDVPESQIDDVLRTGRPQRTIWLYAPMSGVITERLVVLGQAVHAGMPLFTITDLSSVWVNIQLREAEATLVREGTSATLEFAALPGRPYEGRVAYVDPTVNETTRTLAARIVVRNADGQLKPGMYATARLSTPARTALTVPSTAVIQTGERAIVFIDMGDGRLLPHDVELGRVNGELTEVLAGLEPGQRVVSSAQFLLESESNLGDVMKSMIGLSGAGTMGDMPGMDIPGMKMSGADTRGMSGAASTSRPTASPLSAPRAPRVPAPTRRSPP